MTTIILDGTLVNEVIAASHIQNPQDAIVNILTNYLQQHKQQSSLFDQLCLNQEFADDELALLFESGKDSG